ncbi:MAG: SGNH/GDSL hydrolase family protein, partial [Solirubrobacterales bacterium]|nr:SGNH/GDSL hydrolase family protein [Solirubrobacterales bacterium]
MKRLLLALACACALLALPAAASAATGYVALGDSYSSGVGTRDYYPDSGSCDRSPKAYGPLIAAAKGYNLNFQACSGAKTTDVNSGQLGALSSGTGLVTITIGGNDAGFSTVITDCAAEFWNCSSAISTANSFIKNKLPALLNTTYTDIHSRAPKAKVLVLGYPHLFTSDGKTCNADALTPGSEKSLNSTADLLDSTIQSAASAHGFKFVDPRSAFAGHAVCSSSEWLNGLSNPISESFHPNVTGQSQFAA